MNTNDILICTPLRSAIGSFQGAFSNTPAPVLAAELIKELLKRTKLPADKIDEVILGSVLTAGQGQAPARQAVIKGGLPPIVQAMTVNKVCSSGLKAVMLAADKIQLGHATAIIAGGMENMTLAPYLLPTLRAGARLGHAAAEDSIIRDGLWDVYNDFHMGNAAELCAKEFKLSREAQDQYAVESYRRALKAQEQGKFKAEIVPLCIKRGREEYQFEQDEEPGKANLEKIPSLKPVFQKDGTVTAANASSINDGAALMLVCTESFANQHGLSPIARIISQGWYAHQPEWFTTAPVGAIEVALSRAKLKTSDIDLFEINEAFSAVALACGSKAGVPHEKLNIYGGAVALGHPVGASGARILTTLCYALQGTGGRYGVVAICNGGGEATALVVERA